MTATESQQSSQHIGLTVSDNLCRWPTERQHIVLLSSFMDAVGKPEQSLFLVHGRVSGISSDDLITLYRLSVNQLTQPSAMRLTWKDLSDCTATDIISHHGFKFSVADKFGRRHMLADWLPASVLNSIIMRVNSPADALFHNGKKQKITPTISEIYQALLVLFSLIKIEVRLNFHIYWSEIPSDRPHLPKAFQLKNYFFR